MAPARDLVEVSSWNLSACRQKSRSHLALFESVDQDRGLQRHRQTEHHNAFGYLGQSIFSTSPIVSSSCHQLVRSSPESLFWRLSAEAARPANSKAGRNESSAIFAVMGQGEKPPHSPQDSSGQQSAVSSPLSEEKVLHYSSHRQQISSSAADNSLSPLNFTVSRPGTAFDDYHHNLRNYQQHSQHHHHYPQTSTPLGHHHLRNHLSKSVFSLPISTMSAKSSQNRILIKGGKCVNDDAIFDADIYIEEGIIRDIGPHLIVPGGVRTIDARGLYILPGGIDTHTHLNMPFMGTTTCDDFYSGTKAALAGGTTTVMDFVIPPKGVGLVPAFKKWNEWAKDNACCDYAFRVAISEFKKGKTEAEMETLVKEYGVNAFKCFMAYKGDLMLTDEELIAVFAKCRELGALALVHAENGEIIDYNVKKLKSQGVTGPEGHLQSRPEEVEAEATNRAIVLANQVNCPLYVVHVMSRSAADVLASARNRGCLVLGESITAGFGTDGSHYFDRNWRVAAAHVLSPPLRLDQTTSEHLIHLLASGQLQTTGSDHCTFSTEQKEMGAKDFSKIPNGVNGVEERLLILWEKAVKTGILDVKQFVAVTSTNAAKYFNVYPRKGRLQKGSDADIVIWGPKSQTISQKTHHSNVDFNIFEGMHVSSGPQVVISNGKVVLDESGFHVTQGAGRLLSCPPSSPYLYGAINTRAKLGPIKVDRSGKAPGNEAAPPSLAASAAAVAANQPTAAAAVAGAASPPVNGTEHPKLSDLNTLAAMSVHDSQEVSPSAFYKGTTRSGVRNLQDSSFNLNGQQIDDDKVGKSSIRVHNPPGGRSSGIW